jgi:hypothetical protein
MSCFVARSTALLSSSPNVGLLRMQLDLQQVNYNMKFDGMCSGVQWEMQGYRLKFDLLWSSQVNQEMTQVIQV